MEYSIMADIAKVTVSKDALSSLQESINIGKEVLQRKLSAYQNKIMELEKANGMDTEIFKKKFNSGELGDDKEWIEWEHFANVVSLLQKKIIDLETLKYET
jgi:hypothetical protein